MDAVEFLRDFRRMCSSYGPTCTGCKLAGVQCIPTENNCDHKEVIRVVEEWAKAHPVKTRLSEFKKLFPNCRRVQGYPEFCIIDFDQKQKCMRSECAACRKAFWLTPIEEEEE